MFNINMFKRRGLSFYKCFICMCFVITGVFIASYAYNTDFTFQKMENNYIIANLIIKFALLTIIVKYLCTDTLRFFTAPALLIYSGINLGTFLMFILYNFPLYKYLLTIFPCLFKSLGITLLFSFCFEFEKYQNKNTTIYTGGVLCLIGELLLWLMV